MARAGGVRRRHLLGLRVDSALVQKYIGWKVPRVRFRTNISHTVCHEAQNVVCVSSHSVSISTPASKYILVTHCHTHVRTEIRKSGRLDEIAIFTHYSGIYYDRSKFFRMFSIRSKSTGGYQTGYLLRMTRAWWRCEHEACEPRGSQLLESA